MSIEGEGGVTMIGLHSLESLASDGQLPGLQALLSRPRDQWTFRNVIAFPLERTRFPGEAPAVALGPDAESGANVVCFSRRLSRSLRHFRKA